ncbi:MAG: InlB B-repeat-containing protein [Lachnospiraceae bacterium]|nr:InlB B-repeat-containing protein [Lachnospiraceae bacterium]
MTGPKPAKLHILLLAALLFAAAVSSCAFFRDPAGETIQADRRVRVTVLPGEGVTVKAQSTLAEPGSDVEFLLEPDGYTEIVSVGYAGAYTLTPQEDGVLLRLAAVRYPVTVPVRTASDYARVTYDPNGGSGTAHTVVYDVSVRARPNTEQGGESGFYRDGYTLTSWNTEPDGSGVRIGLGSRVTAGRTLTLYAQWARWTDPSLFTFEEDEGFFSVTGYSGGDREMLVIPSEIGGNTVKRIDDRVFTGCTFSDVVLPSGLLRLEREAFSACRVGRLVMSDCIAAVYDESYYRCEGPSTLYVNGATDPFGVLYRRESLFADKIDMLITTMGEPRMVCFGGCSMWYNLDGAAMDAAFGDRFRIVNTAVNGVVSAYVQMTVMLAYMGPGDVLFHTPEISSPQQLLVTSEMTQEDVSLWAGLQRNYDLLALVDLGEIPGGLFDSLRRFVRLRTEGGAYTDLYTDSKGRNYLDAYGCASFPRTEQKEELMDRIGLDAGLLSDLSGMKEMYGRFTEKGIPVYVSYAALDAEDLSADALEGLPGIRAQMENAVREMDGVKLVSVLEDYLFERADYYDTYWHLLTPAASRCTALWIRDLEAGMGHGAAAY